MHARMTTKYAYDQIFMNLCHQMAKIRVDKEKTILAKKA